MYVLRLKQVFGQWKGQWKVSEFCHPFTVGTMDIWWYDDELKLNDMYV
jgi:hypothetical protein